MPSQIPFNSVKDCHNHIARLRQLSRAFDQVTDDMKQHSDVILGAKKVTPIPHLTIGKSRRWLYHLLTMLKWSSTP